MEINNKPLTAAEILALAIPTQFSVQEYLDHRDDWVQVRDFDDLRKAITVAKCAMLSYAENEHRVTDRFGAVLWSGHELAESGAWSAEIVSERPCKTLTNNTETTKTK